MLNVINGGAHAANSIDLQEFMLVPAGADSFAEALRIGVGGLPRAARRAARARARDGRRRRGRLRSRPARRARRRSRRSSRRPNGPGIATASRSRSTRRRARSTATAPTASRARALASDEMPGFWADLLDRYPIVSIEDGLAEDDWDGLGDADRRARRARAARRRRRVRHEPGTARARDRSRRRQLDPVKVNQIGTLTETLEAIAIAQRRRLHRGDLAPLGRDRGRHDRRPRGRDERRPDQDRRAGPLGARREVQPAAAHRGGARRAAAVYPGWARISRGSCSGVRCP